MQAKISIRIAVAVMVALAGAARPAVDRPLRTQAAKAGASSCDIQTTERVVAVGDIYGAFDNSVAILRAAQVIDERNQWIGRRMVLVQTGDVLDRGPEKRSTCCVVWSKRRSGPADEWLSLLGNHELMRLLSDLRYVSPGEIEAFRNGDSVRLRGRGPWLLAGVATTEDGCPI